MSKSNSNLPTAHSYCQGCAEPHHRVDMVLVCIKCIQSKFIPRGGWLSDAFIDKKSIEQWWNHIKKLNIKALIQQIKEQQLAARVRAEWTKPEDDDWEGEEALDEKEEEEEQDPKIPVATL